MEKDSKPQEHSFIMKNRNELALSGVTDIHSFDEKTAVLYTSYGKLTVKGSELHIGSLNVLESSGNVTLTGSFNSFEYGNSLNTGNESLLKKLIK